MDKQEALSGYSENKSFNKSYKKLGAVCGYEHCIETMPFIVPCPIFGHICPGGNKMAISCGEKSNKLWPKVEKRLVKKGGE